MFHDARWSLNIKLDDCAGRSNHLLNNGTGIIWVPTNTNDAITALNIQIIQIALRKNFQNCAIQTIEERTKAAVYFLSAIRFRLQLRLLLNAQLRRRLAILQEKGLLPQLLTYLSIQRLLTLDCCAKLGVGVSLSLNRSCLSGL